MFLTFQPGEVLFLGTTGRWGPQTETNLSYKFALSENASGLSFGELTGIDKKGWEHAWVSHRSDEDQGKGVKVPQYVYVERIYEPVALATALGFGG